MSDNEARDFYRAVFCEGLGLDCSAVYGMVMVCWRWVGGSKDGLFDGWTDRSCPGSIE